MTWRDLLEPMRSAGHGCSCWHIVLDDFNLDRSSINFCVALAMQNGHPACIALAQPMLKASLTQIGKAAKHWDDVTIAPKNPSVGLRLITRKPTD